MWSPIPVALLCMSVTKWGGSRTAAPVEQKETFVCSSVHDLRLERADLKLMRIDYRPEKPDLRPYLWLDRAVPER